MSNKVIVPIVDGGDKADLIAQLTDIGRFNDTGWLNERGRPRFKLKLEVPQGRHSEKIFRVPVLVLIETVGRDPVNPTPTRVGHDWVIDGRIDKILQPEGPAWAWERVMDFLENHRMKFEFRAWYSTHNRHGSMMEWNHADRLLHYQLR